MIFLLIFVFIGIKLVSCCRKYTKDLEEEHEELTFAKVTSKNWFKVLVFLRLVLFVVCCVAGYYFSYGFGDSDKWADEAVESWDKHFLEFHAFHQHDINITLPQDCKEEFQATIAENLVYVENYTSGISNECLKSMSLDQSGISSLTKKPTKLKSLRKASKGSKYPTLVTAVSESNYPKIFGLIENIESVLRKAYHKMEAVLFDFGLSVEHHKAILGNCSFCNIQSYPTEQLSVCERRTKSNGSLPNQSGKISYNSLYKPALIQLILQHHDFVMWINESTRFNTSASFKKIVKGTKGKSIQLPTTEETIQDRDIDQGVFALLHEDPCLFQRQKALDTSMMLIRRNNFTLHAVMRPWVASAFSYMALQSQTKRDMLNITSATNSTLSADDTTDSALLSIILTRLFSVRKRLFLFDFPVLDDPAGLVEGNNTASMDINNTLITPTDGPDFVTIGNNIGNNRQQRIQIVIQDYQNVMNNGTIKYL